MTPFEREFQKEAQKIRMRAVLKRELKEELKTYLEYHPITASAVSKPAAKTAKNIDSRRYTTDQFFHIRFKINGSSWQLKALVGTFAFVFLVGVPLAAERAVPGDVLYPVKVRVNEEVFSSLSMSPYEKIEWETRRVERRIAEARLLAREGRLTEEVEAVISETVREHTEDAARSIAELEENDADEAAVARVALESALDVQTTVLEIDSAVTNTESGETTGESDNSMRDLANVVRNAKAGVIASNIGFNASSTILHDRLMARVEQETTRARELFDAIDNSISEEERADVQRRLEDIDRQILAAQDARALGDIGGLVTLLRGALLDTKKLVTFMTDIDVRASISLESFVPKKLTDTERLAVIDSFVIELRSARGDVLSRISSTSEGGLEEKVVLGIEQIDVLLSVVASSTASGKIVDAETALIVAQALMDDLKIIVGDIPLHNNDDVPTTTDASVSDEPSDDPEGDVSEEDETATTTDEPNL